MERADSRSRLERGDEDCAWRRSPREEDSCHQLPLAPFLDPTHASLKSAKCAYPPNKWLLKQDLQPTGTRAQLLRATENLGKPGAAVSIPAAISWQLCKGSLKHRSGWQGHMAQQLCNRLDQKPRTLPAPLGSSCL